MNDTESDAYARGDDPDTSHAAAKRVRKSSLEVRTGIALQRFPQGVTPRELAAAMGITQRDSVSPRMKPLERKGIAVRTKERRDGQTVWKPAPKPPVQLPLITGE